MSTPNILDDVVNFLHKFADADGIPIVGGNDWDEINSKFTKQEIKDGLAEYIS